jgi:hypothetical protein
VLWSSTLSGWQQGLKHAYPSETKLCKKLFESPAKAGRYTRRKVSHMKHTKSRGILRYIIPQYDEVALFAMSLTCVLLLGIGALSTNWKESLEFSRGDDIRIILMGLVFLLGLTLSIYHAFTDRSKTSIEKFLMLFFAVSLNAFSGLCAGAYVLSRTAGWMVIFPVLNIISAVFLLFMYRTNIIDEESIRDENASFLQIVFTAAVVFILFVVCHYMYKLIWIQTLSICVVYATNIGRRVQPMILSVRSNKTA